MFKIFENRYVKINKGFINKVTQELEDMIDDYNKAVDRVKQFE